MKKRNNMVLTILISLLVLAAQRAGAEDDEMAAGHKLTLTLVEAIADKKDVKEGAREFAKGQFDDWMWDSIGGYEKLWTGQLEGDAYVNQVKGKIDKITEIVSSISECATKLGEGSYDEALFSSIDIAVTVADHPAVSAIWTAVKTAYESHKLVQDTGAELEIEALYGIVNNDRRLLGALDPSSAQPRLIPENAQTADYFFEKYIITNDQARSLVKTYVSKVLGDEWPEQTWGQWLAGWKAVGSGVDQKRSAEIEALDTEFRNKARSWITQLIKDINKQAKVALEEARARKELAEFQNFAKRLNLFSSNLPQILSEFRSKQQYRKELPIYKKYLGDSPTALQDARDKFKDPKKLRQVKEAVDLWKSNLMRSYSAAYLIGEKGLSSSLLEELKKWNSLETEFEKTLPEKQEKIAENPAEISVSIGRYPIIGKSWGANEQIVETLVCTLADVIGYYKSNFAPMLKPFNGWKADSGEIIKQMNDALNAADFKRASELMKKWSMHKEDIDKYYAENWKKLESAIKAKEAEVSGRQLTKSNGVELAKEKCSLEGAREMARQVLGEIAWATDTIFSATAGDLSELYSSFDELRKARAEQWGTYAALIDDMRLNLPIKAVTGKDPDYTHVRLPPSDCVRSLDEGLKRARENVHTMVAPLSPNENIYGLASRIGSLAGSIQGGVWSPEYISSDCQKWFSVWQDAAERWSKAPKLTQEDLEQIEALVRPYESLPAWSSEKALPLDFSKLQQEIQLIEQTASSVPALISQSTAKLKEMAQILDTDGSNRQKDGDWLAQKAKDVDAFFKEQENKGIIRVGHNDYEIALVIGLDNMAVIEKPYRHYATQSELQYYANKLKAGWDRYPVMGFIKKYAPGQYDAMTKLALAQSIKMAPEDNFIPIFSLGDKVIWSGNLVKADKLLSSLKYDMDDKGFDEAIKQFNELIPSTVGASKNIAGWQTMDTIEGRKEYFEHPLGKQYVDLCGKVKKFLDDRLGFKIDERAKKNSERSAEESRKAREEEAMRQQEAMRKQYKGDGRLAELYGFSIINARVNAVSLDRASGDVVLTNTDLKGGAIEITGRFATLDKAEAILISEDDGRTWKEIARARDITYSFIPLPDKLYQPLLKIKTTDIEEINLKLFPGINGIIYRNIDYNQLIVAAVKALADAYERASVSAFAELISRDFIGNLVFLEEGVRFDFDMFIDIRLQIFINRIERRAGTYVAETKWDKNQMVRKTGQQQRTSGRTVFMFVLEDGKMKIKNLRGNLIYATLSPEIAESSGLSQTIVEEIRIAQQERIPVQPGAGQTEQSGGVSFTLQTRSGSITSAAAPPGGGGFDFSSDTAIGANGGDVGLEAVNSFFPNTPAGIQIIAGANFNALNTAPASGYTTGAIVPIVVGDVIAFITTEGYYGKMRIDSLAAGGYPATVTFTYAVQLDRSMDIRTQ